MFGPANENFDFDDLQQQLRIIFMIKVTPTHILFYAKSLNMFCVLRGVVSL